MTQIMNLLNLAPDIQEEILFLPHAGAGREPVSERHVRHIAGVAEWREQRHLWCDCGHPVVGKGRSSTGVKRKAARQQGRR